METSASFEARSAPSSYPTTSQAGLLRRSGPFRGSPSRAGGLSPLVDQLRKGDVLVVCYLDKFPLLLRTSVNRVDLNPRGPHRGDLPEGRRQSQSLCILGGHDSSRSVSGGRIAEQ